ncbi:hypothetical protein MYCTH_2130249 [Thermothelomyces thermophilus ATCC 42464]|uniref:Uncharacterized protein n=1 Tax=Thermothelomyces thermophilus (strain ATCC 42464 / BCRC 31852 / DSM 1799) TaxID=573729 RepID=G2QMC2_THET4|nr:uncharacterized protein MYCTH_2130249 [Thermothelomyces thermophilus ATCC 42464]AEO61102.1 hypothetical protein MYCTH_2130249 [Thermothelomyces thermophilus ATCC 42464]
MVQNGGDFDLDTNMATDELENREKYSQKLVNEAYAKIEALETAKASRIKIELPGKYRGTKEDLVGFLTNLRSYFRLNNDKFPDDKAKVLYAIRIDDRLYIREQQKRGRMNGTTVKANDKKKRAPDSYTEYRDGQQLSNDVRNPEYQFMRANRGKDERSRDLA